MAAKIKGQITTSARLRELTPQPSYSVWFISGGDLYEMNVKEHRSTDVRATLMLQREGAGPDPLLIDLSYPSLSLDGASGSYKIFALRSHAEQYIRGE